MNRAKTIDQLRGLLEKAKEEGLVEDMGSLARYNKCLAKLLYFYYNLFVISPIHMFSDPTSEDVFGRNRRIVDTGTIMRLAKKMDMEVTNYSAYYYSKAIEILCRLVELESQCNKIIMKYYMSIQSKGGGKKK